jgi:hypothetical protein
MPDSEHMVVAGMRIRQMNPELWNDFVLGVREYAAQVTESMKQATPDNLPKAQGMAIMASEIAAILIKAPETYTKIDELRRGRAHVQNLR